MADTLVEILENAASIWPDDIAYACQDEKFTFVELDHRANQISNALLDIGLSAGECVGVLLPRSIHTPSGCYGVLKAGGVFVPLDPQASIEHNAGIIADCNIRVLICDGATRPLRRLLNQCPKLAYLIGAQVAERWSRSWSEMTQYPTEAPSLRRTIAPDDTAYLMFTSGSTGKPKGIAHSHSSGLSYARLAVRTYAVTAQDRIASFAPLQVDQSTFALFCGPLAGATVVIVPDQYISFAANMAELIANEAITIWYSVPLPLIMILESGVLTEHKFPALRWVTYGGEPFPPRQIRALMQHWPRAKFSNIYGPAEVNQCTYYHFGQADVAQATSIPIGHIWEETIGRVLNENGQEVTPGEVGELCIHSSTMMQGYWQRPDLDAQVFCELSTNNGVRRFYKTGDLVQADANGLLHFLGRRDRQVKIRGRRVELEAVEACFNLHPDVIEAAVFVTDDGAHVQELVAVILAANEAIDLVALKKHVAKHLATFARPKETFVVSTLPRSGAGKIDRNALAQQYAEGTLISAQ